MRIIVETIDDENYLEFLLSSKEVQSISSSKIVSTIGEIGNSVYQVGIRLIFPGETFEYSEAKMPLIKSASPEAVHANISEMVKAGHPKDQAVAAALDEARKARKELKPKKKG